MGWSIPVGRVFEVAKYLNSVPDEACVSRNHTVIRSWFVVLKCHNLWSRIYMNLFTNRSFHSNFTFFAQSSQFYQAPSASLSATCKHSHWLNKFRSYSVIFMAPFIIYKLQIKKCSYFLEVQIGTPNMNEFQKVSSVSLHASHKMPLCAKMIFFIFSNESNVWLNRCVYRQNSTISETNL